MIPTVRKEIARSFFRFVFFLVYIFPFIFCHLQSLKIEMDIRHNLLLYLKKASVSSIQSLPSCPGGVIRSQSAK